MAKVKLFFQMEMFTKDLSKQGSAMVPVFVNLLQRVQFTKESGVKTNPKARGYFSRCLMSWSKLGLMVINF